MKWLRWFGIYLLVSTLFGLIVGAWLRNKIETPNTYIGFRGDGSSGGIALAAHPWGIGHPGSGVLETGQHEEQIRESV